MRYAVLICEKCSSLFHKAFSAIAGAVFTVEREVWCFGSEVELVVVPEIAGTDAERGEVGSEMVVEIGMRQKMKAESPSTRERHAHCFRLRG